MAEAVAGGAGALFPTKGLLRNYIHVLILVFALLCVMTASEQVCAGSLTTTVTTVLTELFQGPVFVKSAKLHRLGTLSVEGIEVFDPVNTDKLMLSVERVDFNYSLLGLFLNMNNMGRAITGLEIIGPVLRVAREKQGWNISRLVQTRSDNSERLSRELRVSVSGGRCVIDGLEHRTDPLDVLLDGSVILDEGGAVLDDVQLSLFDAAMVGSGTIGNGSLDLQVQTTKLDFRKLVQYFPQLEDLALDGWASFQASITGSLFDPIICGTVSMGSASFSVPSYSGVLYQLDSLDGRFRYQNQHVYIEDLVMQRGESAVRVAGKIGVDGQLDLDATIAKLDMSQYVVGLKDYGFTGKVDFSGRVTGYVSNPILEGNIRTVSSTFLGRRVDKMSGAIILTSRNLAIKNLTLFQDEIPYFLEGTIGLRGVRWIDLALTTSGGSVEEILAALGVDGGLTAKMDGMLHFTGPLWRVEVEGKVRLTDGQFMGQPFDYAEGKFAIAGDQVYVTDGLAMYNEASLAFSGGGMRGGTFRLDVQAAGWHVDDIRLLENSAELVHEAGSDPIAFTGQAIVEGSLAEARGFLEGTVSVAGSQIRKRVNLRVVSRSEVGAMQTLRLR